jgi:alkylation response protein AidB-like acyl-CoA dehydrogenase
VPPELRPEIARRVVEAASHLASVVAEDPDTFRPAAADVVRAAGLHLLAVPESAGGLGGGLREAVEVLAAIGAVDGATALGLAMHLQVVGGAVECAAWPAAPLDRLLQAVVREGALVNAASTEEGTGSPSRGGLPDTRAVGAGDAYRVTGEKTYTTWLPALRFAVVSARLEHRGGSQPAASPTVGLLLVDLELPGVERLPGFEALGMRGSASGRVRFTDVAVPRDMLIMERAAGQADPRGASPQGWFAGCLAATYLGVGEGARAAVVRWAIDRRPGDGSTAVADIPSVQVRLGRLDAAMRIARTVLIDAARRWDGASPSEREALMPDLQLAKVCVTNAAVEATDDALRIAGGPGFLAGPIERAFRDARAGLINPPLDDVAYQAFARALVDRERGGP